MIASSIIVSLCPNGQYTILFLAKEHEIHCYKNFNLKSPPKAPHPQFPVTTSFIYGSTLNPTNAFSSYLLMSFFENWLPENLDDPIAIASIAVIYSFAILLESYE
jgi:hypothetical protein